MNHALTPGSNTAAAALVARLERGKTIVREAGQIALGYFNRGADREHELDIQTKGSQDWVSRADQEVEQFIRSQLRDSFPEDAVVGEEYGQDEVQDQQLLWVIDPIDGTTCFLKGIPQWCIVIALSQGSTVLLSIIYDPVARELYHAQAGSGAWLNNRAISVAPSQSLQDGLISVGSSVQLGAGNSARLIEQLVASGGMYSRIGSCALGLAYVASGRLLGMYEPLIHPWDSWAGELLVQEAGGRTLERSQGADLGRPGPTIAATPGVWDAIDELLR
ncbi:inositol monophosphatase [Natronospirillum operosum]|uniref:Inositol-1-monophosphatase n=1 Tax=Natronospirillum operosum TaxID=2759953 RepID=A0A4Z0WDV0_9GAMM|nr:inositol monophosphatase [Natronospirillum operosum]TGG95180.1 inositol monophosphatase [Natronospirillum operosum]